MGIATNLQTMTSDAVKKGLTISVDTGKPIVDCLRDAGLKEMEERPKEHYLYNERVN